MGFLKSKGSTHILNNDQLSNDSKMGIMQGCEQRTNSE